MHRTPSWPISNPTNSSKSAILLGILLSACTGNGGDTNAQPGGSAGTNASTAGSAGTNTASSGGSGTGGSNTGGSSTGGSHTGGSSTGGSNTGGSNTGGSSTGGSSTGGAGGYKPTTIADCNNLPSPGKWEDVSPAAFKNPSNMETWAVVLGIQDQRIYAAAGNKTNNCGSNCVGTGAYESTDCGATWTKKTTGQGSDKLLTGDPWAMLIDPRDPDVIYIDNGYGADPTLYKSTNAGVDWTALWPHPTWKQTSFVQAIAMDPADPEHLAVTFHTTCEAPYNGMCLSRSNDGGQTWSVFNGPSAITGWSEGASLSILGPKSYLTTFGFGGGAWYTADEGQTWKEVVSTNFDGSYAGGTAIIDGVLYLAGASTLHKSTSNPLGSVFTDIAGSQRLTVMISDGTNLYGGYAWNYGGNPMYSAPLSDLTHWTQNMTAPSMGRGPYQMAYDPVHHIIYSASIGAGLWRMVAK